MHLVFICLFLVLPQMTMAQEKVIAKINGQIVTASEYYGRMEFLPHVGAQIGKQFVEIPPALLTLEQIVNDHLIMQLAKQRGVVPSDFEIEGEFTKWKQANRERYELLQSLGVSDKSLRDQVAREIAQFKIITQGVTVTDQQVIDHYNGNQGHFTMPAVVKVRAILVKTQGDKNRVDEALKTRPFDEVARLYSQDPTGQIGGELPEVPIVNLPEHTRKAIEATSEGKVTEWVQGSDVFVKYQVIKKTSASVIPLDDALKAAIRQNLMVEIGSKQNDVKSMLNDLRKSAKVELTNPGLQKLWEQHNREILKATSDGNN